MNRLFSPWLLLAWLPLSGCLHSGPHNARQESFEGQRVTIPAELRRGTATPEAAEVWLATLLGANPLESFRLDLDGDGHGELFLSQPARSGTGGNTQFIFQETPGGLRYWGRLGLASTFRALPPDARGRVRLLTSGSGGGGECLAVIEVLMPDGFQRTVSRALPCGDSATDGAGGLQWQQLFAPTVPPPEVLRAVFGEEWK